MTTDPAPSAITAERTRLTNLAYRFLGSLSEAEDAVQEAYARWYAMPREKREAVESPGAWLTTVASRVCLDVLGSARARRESYVGQWVPEPLPDRAEWADAHGGPGADPADRITLDESVDMAFLVVLEAMTPAERVAFILHDVFRYPFADVAGILGRTPAACRQLAASARRRVGPSRPHPGPAAGRARVIRDFKRAWEAKDVAALVGLLDPGATMVADGGGLVGAVAHPVVGADRIARYLTDTGGRSTPGMTLLERSVNGRPGLVARFGTTTVTVAAFALEGDRITRIWAVRNPEKLRIWN
ncbi:RNA polymerase sigma factor SigJ [Streptomyces sp. WAC07061]|uniref:RNA polymerase sigma factor SigJ n=1 Tax=Streptomyces sp. WAC07061 TaxID=2487410 RepID=UPI000F770E5C|nr:RNA polymerase sigma factor SigJ [Streptomyces sp. WAC07061]RSS46901.1 RNA polymerase sigma factor SigJ [Streptomyces sp. WAC07061]